MLMINQFYLLITRKSLVAMEDLNFTDRSCSLDNLTTVNKSSNVAPPIREENNYITYTQASQTHKIPYKF